MSIILKVTNKRALRLRVELITLILLIGLFPFTANKPISASPDALKWSIVDTPSEEGNVVVGPSEINTFVVASDDETFYAIDIPTWYDDDEDGIVDPNEIGKVYKSTDGGISWNERVTRNLILDGASLPVWDIAVAPGNPELLVVVTDDRQKVYGSNNGGDSWEDMNVPGLGDLLISDIIFSPEYGGDNRDIAIGARNPDGIANGDIWVTRLGGFSAWKAQDLDIDVTSVRFSPSYSSDKTILAIASDVDATYLCTGIRDTNENSTQWEVTDPPKVAISQAAGDSPGESEIIMSSLALPSDYFGKDVVSRIVYAAYSSDTAADDVYLIRDATVKRLDVEDGDRVSIASIAYHGTTGQGELLAGEVAGEADSASALIHICSNPRGNFLKWEEPDEPPTGGAVSDRANAQLAWSSDGSVVYCGTSTNHLESAADWANMTLPAGPWNGEVYDESSFSVSNDDGDTWNQISLIDTDMSRLWDYGISADYETLYLVSVGSGFDSLWRSESEPLGERWQRILCLDSEGNEILIRPGPEEGEEAIIFIALVDTADARYSFDKGETWVSVWDSPYITDLAVVNNEKFYILGDDNMLHVCTWSTEIWEDGVWEWQRDIDTGLLSAYSVAISGGDYVLVAEDEDGEGKIAYSTDGGATFELIEALTEEGKIQVTPDEEFGSNRFIYAATDESTIYRWTVEGSTSWEDLNPWQSGFYGLAQKGGALYGAYSSGVARTLIPHKERVTPSDWDSLTVGLESGTSFKSGSLKAMSNDGIDLWSIDDREYGFTARTGCLWIYSDTVVFQTPWPTSPPLRESLSCDPCTCEASKFYFGWQKLPKAEEYELRIALDEDFNFILTTVNNIAPDDPSNPAWSIPANTLSFGCGMTYYWKVRSSQSTEGEVIHSPWSPTMSFSVKTSSSTEELHTTPILKAPENGSIDVSRSPGFSWTGFPDTKKYQFILAMDASLTQIIVKEELPTSAYQYNNNLDWGVTYYWQVMAVEPVPSDPAMSTFTVMPEPSVAPPPPPPAPLPTPATPLWIWLVIGIIALLIIVIIALCLIKR